jgi:DNA-binding ferritin-like protein
MKLEILQHLLALLRVVHLSHWTSHWQVKGENFHADHMMLAELYEMIEDEIDMLAEKIVGEFGSDAVHLAPQLERMEEIEENMSPRATAIQRALVYEELLQQELSKAYDTLKNLKGMSLGLDDFIMSIASAHETNLYKLRQRARPRGDA